MKAPSIVFAGCAAGLLALFGTTTAMAASDPEVGLGTTATLQARILVHVPIVITCAVGDIPEFNSLTVSQAAGHTTTTASGFLNGVVCDGNQHIYDGVATVWTGHAPLHGGAAVAEFDFTVGTCQFVNSDGSCAFVGNPQSALTGPVVIRIR